MATPTALIQQKTGAVVAGASVPQAWPNASTNAQNLDLIQIIDIGGSIVLNVDYLGTVHNPAVNPTTSGGGGTGQVRIAQYLTRLASGSTTAAFFADAFENLAQLDILQVISPTGGNVTYSLNYLGVASGS
jgi:hypothetical protein